MSTNVKFDAVANCPVCGVSITPKGEVIFSQGSSGTRARLHARVCQYTDRSGCINRDAALIGEVTRTDGFQSGDELQFPVPFAGNSPPAA